MSRTSTIFSPPFPIRPGSFWLVIYEHRPAVITIAPKGDGFFACGQEELWPLSEVQAWLRHIPQVDHPDRNTPEALQGRLNNAEKMLVDALNLIGKMQPVVTAADEFYKLYESNNPDFMTDNELQQLQAKDESLKIALANYVSNQKSAISNAQDHLPPERDRDNAIHGQATPP